MWQENTYRYPPPHFFFCFWIYLIKHQTSVLDYMDVVCESVPTQTFHICVDNKVLKMKSRGDQIFTVAATKRWNILPLHVLFTESTEVFKSLMKILLFMVLDWGRVWGSIRADGSLGFTVRFCILFHFSFDTSPCLNCKALRSTSVVLMCYKNKIDIDFPFHLNIVAGKEKP